MGLAGLAAFTIFGLVNNSKFSDLESECPNDRCPERLADGAEAGRTYQTLANVGLGVGLVGLGTAAVLLLTDSSPAETEAVVTAAAPRLLIGPSYVGVRGGF